MKKLVGSLCVLGLAAAANADVIISAVGAGSGYGVTGTEVAGYRSTGVAKTYDIDGDGAYGTAGYIVFGGANSAMNKQALDGKNTLLGNPTFGTFAAGEDFNSVSRQTTYPKYDDPTETISADVVDLGASAIALGTGGGVGGAGAWNEIITFTVDSSTPLNFRVGILAGNEMSGDGRWSSTGFGLSFEGGTVTEIAGLGILTDETGMVFFDVAIEEGTIAEGDTGTFSIVGQQRLAGQGASLAGVTIDVIPEPATIGMLGLGTIVTVLMRRRRKLD